MNRLRWAIRGRSGLLPWWVLHVVMYGALFLGWVALVLTVEEGGNVVRAMREIPGLLVLSLGPFAPYVIMATTAAVAAAWLFRGLGTVRFRVVAVLLCCAPLMCVLSPEALRLLVPVQAVFGLIVTRPRWIHPLDVDYDGDGR